jgi:hypothetical protein
LALRFVDPTIPGLSGRDLVGRAGDTVVNLAEDMSSWHVEFL